MKKIKIGKLPVNARITIDYENEKDPKIKFGYPKKNAVEQNYFLVFTIIMGIMVTIVLYFLAYGFPLIEYYNTYPKECNIQQHYNGTVIKNITLSCDNGIKRVIVFTQHYRTKNLYFNHITKLTKDKTSGFYINHPELSINQKLFSLFILITSVITFIIFIPFLVSKPITKLLIKWKWFKKKIPKINSAMEGFCRRAVFKKVPDNLIIEIPLFYNVKMHYKTKKEFSEYLRKVEIKEHPFNRVLIRKGKIKKKKKNITYWYARFYFKQKPKKGGLEVMFK